MAPKRTISGSSMVSSKKRALLNRRPGVPSLDQFYAQLQTITMVVGNKGKTQDRPSASTSSSSTSPPSPSIRFTESAVLGLRQIFGTYLQHVAAVLSDHDSLTQDGTILACLAEVTNNNAIDDGDVDSDAESNNAPPSSSSTWNDLPRQAKELLAETAAQGRATNRTTNETTSSATDTVRPEKLTSSSSSFVSPPVTSSSSAITAAAAAAAAAATTTGIGNASTATHGRMEKDQTKKKKRRQRMIVTKEMEAEQERLLTTSKESMVEKQKQASSLS